METQFPSLAIPVLLFFSTLIFIKLLTRSKPKIPTPNLPPGPWKLPLIGNIHNLMGSLPHRALHQLALKYGPLMHLQLGELSAVVVSSPDAAKQFMKTHDLNFASRPPILAVEIMSYDCTNISFSPYGDYWKQLRKICTLELLSPKRVQSFRSLREEVFSDLTRWIGGMEGTPVNLTEKFYSSTYALVVTAVLGKVTTERKKLLPLIEEALEFAGGFDIVDLYPSVKFFRRISAAGRRLTVLKGESDKILEDIISEHKEANSVKSDEEQSSKQEDLVDVLLKFQDGGLEHSLTNDNIKAVILDVLTAGSETAATTMDWAMAEMLKNPEILKKAQEEVRDVFEGNGFVDESCIHELTYLKAVIKETLRMHPPVPLLLPRICAETCEIDGYHIPANTKIIINAWAINRDSKNWKDGECFHPERFVDTTVDFRGNHFEFLPFGAGRRICPGISFGLANVELPLAMLLYHFDWKLSCGDEMDMKEGCGITTRRLNNLCLVPAIARPLPLPLPTK
ncbi:hypothetical protein ACS0TY_032547 [Phlomoides rotata]